jgi:hypothetical protein
MSRLLLNSEVYTVGGVLGVFPLTLHCSRFASPPSQHHQDTRTPPGKRVGSCTTDAEPGSCQLYARPLADGACAR